MNIKTTINNQWRRFLTLDRSARLFILITVMTGIFFAGWDLFFNLYILAKGFDKEFLGLANSLYPAAVLLFGIPMGMLSDRIGRKYSLLIGQIFFLISFLIIAITSSGTVILAVSFIGGVVDTLYIVSVTPLLAQLSNKANRNYLFSIVFGLATLSRMVGSFLAGQLPLWFENVFGFQSSTALSYQAVLITCIGLTFLTLIPLLMIKLPEKVAELDENGERVVSKVRNGYREKLQNILKNKVVWKLFIPNLQIGLGSALIIPYLNLYFVEKFFVNDQTLGLLFSLGALATGLASLFSPRLANRLGTRIRAIVLVQGSSLLFLLVLGFSPVLGIVMIGFMARGALMNMGHPLFESFTMDQVSEDEQGTLNSVMILSWEIGWAVGPFVSGLVQERYGFNPLFVAMALLYASAIIMIWFFFQHTEKVSKSGQAYPTP